MTTKATRHPKTPAQRAQETVDVLTRRLAKIRTAKDALELQVTNVKVDEINVQKRLTYAEASPDLPKITDAKAPSATPTKEEAK